MPSDPDRPPTTPGLASLGGQPAPDGFAEAVRSLAVVPPPARADVPGVAVQLARHASPQEAEALIATMRQRHGVGEQTLSRGLRALATLLAAAFASDVSPAHVAADLERLSLDDEDLRAAVARAYAEAAPSERARLLDEALADHGRVLTGLTWRVDRIGDSNRLRGADATVVWLTLETRTAKDTERWSVQVTPARLRELGAFCEQLVRATETDG